MQSASCRFNMFNIPAHGWEPDRITGPENRIKQDNPNNKEVSMNSWICDKCGYNMEADKPPEKCPSCNADCSFVDNTCYTPDCAGQPSDPQIKGGS